MRLLWQKKGGANLIWERVRRTVVKIVHQSLHLGRTGVAWDRVLKNERLSLIKGGKGFGVAMY